MDLVSQPFLVEQHALVPLVEVVPQPPLVELDPQSPQVEVVYSIYLCMCNHSYSLA